MQAAQSTTPISHPKLRGFRMRDWLLKGILCAGVCLLVPACATPQSAFQTTPQTNAAALVGRCEARLTSHPTNQQINLGNQCVAYLAGFVDAKGLMYHSLCFLGFDYDTMARAYVRWMANHRDQMEKPQRVAVEAALADELCPNWKDFEQKDSGSNTQKQ
jgi:hypothetical protein